MSRLLNADSSSIFDVKFVSGTHPGTAICKRANDLDWGAAQLAELPLDDVVLFELRVRNLRALPRPLPPIVCASVCDGVASDGTWVCGGRAGVSFSWHLHVDWIHFADGACLQEVLADWKVWLI